MHKITKYIVLGISLCFPTLGFTDGFIDVPDACYVVKKIDEEKVFLHEIGNCSGKEGRAFVKTDKKQVKVFLGQQFWKDQKLQQMNMDDVSAFLDNSTNQGAEIKLKINPYTKQMSEMAQKTVDYYKSSEFQKKIAEETARIRIGGVTGINTVAKNHYPDAVQKKENERLKSDERLYVFVSSSMPIETIRAYVASVEKMNDPNISIILRGFVGGMKKINPTLSFIAEVLKKDPFCDAADCVMRKANVTIDPMVYKRYNIQEVPAFVFVSGLELGDEASSEGKKENIKKSDEPTIAYGDASLEYIREKIWLSTCDNRLTD